MKRPTVCGKIEEVYYVQLTNGEDLLEAIWDICKEHDIKTGLVLDGNGAVDKFVYEKFPESPEYTPIPVAVATLEGPCEVRVSGTIGSFYCEDPAKCTSFPNNLPTIPGVLNDMRDKWAYMGTSGQYGVYLHSHMVATNGKYETVCGHLLRGTHVYVTPDSGLEGVPSHFTVVIAKVSGVELKVVSDESGYYHTLVDTKA